MDTLDPSVLLVNFSANLTHVGANTGYFWSDHVGNGWESDAVSGVAPNTLEIVGTPTGDSGLEPLMLGYTSTGDPPIGTGGGVLANFDEFPIAI